MQNQSINRAVLATSIPAALVWLGVLAFLGKWVQLWATGRLQAGIDTSRTALLIVFLVALLASAGGIYLSIRAWQGGSHLKWQVLSLIGAIVVLWAVSGD